MSYSRRDFVKFVTGAVSSAATLSGASLMATGCISNEKSSNADYGISPSDKDDLVLAKGLESKIVIGYNEVINSKGEKFGFNNDYTAFMPLDSKSDEALLWVNHEYTHPLFVGGWDRTKENILEEQKAVGGSIVHIKKDGNGDWVFQPNSKYNRRIDANTKIPFSGDTKVMGKDHAYGTLSNCAGGITPWGTVLTCEENYQDAYGEVEFKTNKRSKSRMGWEKFYPDRHPFQYGWVVEVDVKTGKAQKHTGIGRYAHECATCIVAKDGRTVVYSGDDKAGEFIYKFISDKPNSLEKGKLYVADLKKGQWQSLNYDDNPIMRKHFKDQTEVLIHARTAGRFVGATPCDRPEDFEIQPKTNNVFVSLTNNKKRGNYHGSILKIEETNNDPLSLTFKAADFAVGGDDSGFSCPDNLAFDKSGNLWMVSDMSGGAMNKPPYSKFKNNGLFYFPMSGPHAGQAIQIASAPVDAELTGLSFSSDHKTLFVSVQHPGERSNGLNELTSTWPRDKMSNGIPRPCVVQVQGPLLDRLV
jgi:secreted PhoX family phosphatase